MINESCFELECRSSMNKTAWMNRRVGKDAAGLLIGL
jgi:hypothetical protein